MKNSAKIFFSVIMGVLYLLFGVIEIGAYIFPALAVAGIPADILGGFVLCVIGLVFFAGVPGLRSGTPGAIAYLFVGLLISLAFGLIAVLTIGAGWLEIALFEEMTEWPVEEMVVPMLFLAIGSVAGYIAWGREFFRGIARA